MKSFCHQFQWNSNYEEKEKMDKHAETLNE